MYPEKSNSIFTGFGEEVAIYGNHLAISSPSHDSLAFNSGVVSLYKNVDGFWVKQARLTPSEPYERMYFGSGVSMNENMVLVFARHENKYTKTVLYVYTKSAGEEWVDGHESFQFAPYEMGDELLYNQMSIDLNNRFLAVSYYESPFNRDSIVHKVKIYDIQTEGFELVWSYNPANAFGEDAYFPTPTLGDDFLVLTNGDSPGRAIIFSYDDAHGWEDDFVELTPSVPNQVTFGQSVAIAGNSIFISNKYTPSEDGLEHNIFYFEKNGPSWTSMNEKSILTTGISSASYQSMEALDEVVAFSNLENIYLFDKGEGWKSKSVDLVIDLVDKHPAKFLVSMAMENDYLIYGLIDPDGLLEAGNQVYSHALSSSSPFDSDAFDTGAQVLMEKAFHSAGDQFAVSSSFYKDEGVVGSNVDDDAGRSVGAVYLYQRNNTTLEWEMSRKLYPSQIQAYMNFGYDVSVSDDMLFISAPFYDSLDSNDETVFASMGKVYQYKKTPSGWELAFEIISPDVTRGIPTSAVSNMNEMTNFRPTETSRISDQLSVSKADIESSDNSLRVTADVDYRNFGMSLTYHRGYLAVGQRNYNASNHKGRIYLFKQSKMLEWDHIATLTTSDSYRDWLGMVDIVMNDSLIITGNSNGIYTGEIGGSLVFKKEGNEWVSKTEDAVLVPDRSTMDGSYPLEEFDNAGFDVAIFEDYIVTGAPTGNRSSRTGANSGRAYVYRKPQGGWEGEVAYSNILEPENPIENSLFGFSIYMDDKNILVGAPHSFNQIRRANRDLDTTLLPGRVYVFDSQKLDSDTIHEIGVILPNDGDPLDGFGADISQNFIELVIQAPFADTDRGFRSGQAYMFKKVSAIEEDIDPICSEGGRVDLIAYPVQGGTWSGEGIVDAETGLFDASNLEEGTYQVTYQYGDCISSTYVEVYNPPAIKSKVDNEVFICKGDTAELFVIPGNANHDINWYFREQPEGEYELLQKWHGKAEIFVANIGTYKCSISNGVCKDVSSEFNVFQLDEPKQLNHQEPLSICEGDTVSLQLSAQNAMDEYYWYGDNTGFGTFEPVGSEAVLSVYETGNYRLEFHSDGCVYHTDTLRVDRTDIEILFEPLEDVCNAEAVIQFNVSPVGGIFTIPGFYSFEETAILASSLGNGSFTVEYDVNLNNCHKQLSQDLNIHFFDLELLQVPNVFTPNGDGFNDTYFLQSNYYDFEAFQFLILSRDGSKVFQTNDPEFKWTGNGLPSGVYYWFMAFENPCTGNEYEHSGYVHLLK